MINIKTYSENKEIPAFSMESGIWSYAEMGEFPDIGQSVFIDKLEDDVYKDLEYLTQIDQTRTLVIGRRVGAAVIKSTFKDSIIAASSFETKETALYSLREMHPIIYKRNGIAVVPDDDGLFRN